MRARHQEERRKDPVKRIMFQAHKYLKNRSVKVQESLDQMFGKTKAKEVVWTQRVIG